MDTFSLRNVQYENRSLDTMRFSGGSQTTAVSQSVSERERERERERECVFLRSSATATPCLPFFFNKVQNSDKGQHGDEATTPHGCFQSMLQPCPPALQISIEGKEESMAGLSVYVVGSFTASAAIILVSDVFGWMTPQLRKLADKAAAAGYLAIVPDYMHGDPFKPSPEGGRAGFAEWIVKHHPEGGVEVTKEMVKIIKSKGISAVGLAGFCWGSKVAALVGKEPNIVEAIVQLHPSFVQASDYEDVKAHIAVLAAPSDGVDKHADILSAHTQIDTFLKVFPNVKHGWTVKYDMDNHEEVAEAEAAHQMMFSWFDNYLTGNQVLPLHCPFNGNGSLTTSSPQVLSPYDLNSNGSVTTSTPEVLP